MESAQVGNSEQAEHKTPKGARPWDELEPSAQQLFVSISDLASLKKDQLKTNARRAVERIVILCALGALWLALMISACLYVVAGLAQGIEALFDNAWAGDLLAGLICLSLGGMFLMWARHRVQAKSIQRLQQKYSHLD